jgi:ribose 5-phosphate isomerase B
MKIFIGADHRGFELKEKLKGYLASLGYEVVDCGNTKLDPLDDFPDYAFAVADNVAEKKESLGIVICGSAGGVTIAANKVKTIRCAEGIKPEDVSHNRLHNNINVLALASDFLSFAEASRLAQIFITTIFVPEERFIRRIGKISQREENSK